MQNASDGLISRLDTDEEKKINRILENQKVKKQKQKNKTKKTPSNQNRKSQEFKDCGTTHGGLSEGEEKKEQKNYLKE